MTHSIQMTVEALTDLLFVKPDCGRQIEGLTGKVLAVYHRTISNHAYNGSFTEVVVLEKEGDKAVVFTRTVGRLLQDSGKFVWMPSPVSIARVREFVKTELVAKDFKLAEAKNVTMKRG